MLHLSSEFNSELKEEEKDEWLELCEDYYSLAFFVFFIDDDEKEENSILS